MKKIKFRHSISEINSKNLSSRRLFCSFLLLFSCVIASAQQITQIHGVVSDELGPLIGAAVCEVDANDRIINSTITDFNGNFTMKVNNQKDKVKFTYVGMKAQVYQIDRTTYNVKLESTTTIQEVVVKSKKRMQGNSLPIPENEISYATQRISMDEFEGLGITSVDEALQGRIAGLDIIGNSGDLGAGSTMRLRGVSSLSSLTDTDPLIVVDGNIRSVDMETFDLSSANDEKFAELLNINPEDIASIAVLKDAAATAIYGSQGGSGVIEITTKRGSKGKPKLTYTLKLTTTYQPSGYDLLSGDDYTMLIKEALFNPTQDDNASANINEINYVPTFSEYEQYNNNTDWRDAVTQWGLRQNHYVSISGGGEKATFRIGAGYDHETGTIIKQVLDRFSTRVALDYYVSQRIRVSTNFALTYTENQKNSDDLLAIAMKKMPNMSIYEQDPNTGANTNVYYTMLESASSEFDESYRGAANNQKGYINPVASANLAKNNQTTYDMSPELIIKYQLLGLDEDHWQLNWQGSVYMNIFNEYDDTYYPSELSYGYWGDNKTSAGSSNSKSVSFNTKHTLTLIPAFRNKDHSLMMMGRFELTSGSSSASATGGSGLPSGTITRPDAGGLSTLSTLSSSYSQWRSIYFTYSAHYSYKSRYTFDFSIRADGTSKFGPGKRWGYFPAVSLRWNISEEPFMNATRKWLSMLSLRPSWGIVGSQPNTNYLYTSKYASSSTYINLSSIYPQNIRLTDLRWQIVSSYNIGMDIGLFDDRFSITFEAYHSTTSDMLMSNYRIPSNTGYTSVPYRNSGKMRNIGWEFHINTNKLIKKGKFYMDVNVNFGNNRNEILYLDEYVLNSLNSEYSYSNAEYLQRVQLHNPFGAIYGFKYKGVYQYNYDTFAALSKEEQAEFIASGKTAPVSINEDGSIVYGTDGKPVRMMFNYTNDATGKNYKFCGGDAIYEDTNHDGNIDALDIVYLGSSLPTLTGGFGLTFNYAGWKLNCQFTYRVGNKILNLARLEAEAMTTMDNQSQQVNYRWRKEGDVTDIPRAMYGSTSNYNTLVSDRFVESGTYLRMSYAQLSYSIPKKYIKWSALSRISFYLSANNPFVLTKYSGVDPDITNSGYAPAIDWSKTPRSKSYTLGLTVDF